MRQTNVTGYTLVVQPPDGSHLEPFELAPGESVDYPEPITGCATEPPPAAPAPDQGNQPDTTTSATKPDSATTVTPSAKTKTAATADGGDTK